MSNVHSTSARSHAFGDSNRLLTSFDALTLNWMYETVGTCDFDTICFVILSPPDSVMLL